LAIVLRVPVIFAQSLGCNRAFGSYELSLLVCGTARSRGRRISPGARNVWLPHVGAPIHRCVVSSRGYSVSRRRSHIFCPKSRKRPRL